MISIAPSDTLNQSSASSGSVNYYKLLIRQYILIGLVLSIAFKRYTTRLPASRCYRAHLIRFHLAEYLL